MDGGRRGGDRVGSRGRRASGMGGRAGKEEEDGRHDSAERGGRGEGGGGKGQHDKGRREDKYVEGYLGRKGEGESARKKEANEREGRGRREGGERAWGGKKGKGRGGGGVRKGGRGGGRGGGGGEGGRGGGGGGGGGREGEGGEGGSEGGRREGGGGAGDRMVEMLLVEAIIRINPEVENETQAKLAVAALRTTMSNPDKLTATGKTLDLLRSQSSPQSGRSCANRSVHCLRRRKRTPQRLHRDEPISRSGRQAMP